MQTCLHMRLPACEARRLFCCRHFRRLMKGTIYFEYRTQRRQHRTHGVLSSLELCRRQLSGGKYRQGCHKKFHRFWSNTMPRTAVPEICEGVALRTEATMGT